MDYSDREGELFTRHFSRQLDVAIQKSLERNPAFIELREDNERLYDLVEQLEKAVGRLERNERTRELVGPGWKPRTPESIRVMEEWQRRTIPPEVPKYFRAIPLTEEVRRDLTDGLYYSRKEFIYRYGNKDGRRRFWLAGLHGEAVMVRRLTPEQEYKLYRWWRY
jgi:hypothetical protein